MSLLKVLAKLFRATPPVPEPAPQPDSLTAQPGANQKTVRSCRAIEAVDPTSGEIKFTFESVNAAGREGFGYQGVYNVLTGSRKTYKGLTWRYGATSRKALRPKRPRHGRPVEAVDANTDEVRERFPDVRAAVAAGFDSAGIRKVLAGLQKTHRGLGWRHCTAATVMSSPAGHVESSEIASALLTDALRRDELARLRKDIFFDENQQEWGVRLKGRTLYRPRRHDAVQLWYDTPEEERLPGTKPPAAPPIPIAVAAPRRQRCSQGRFTRIEAFDPETGQVAHIFKGVQDAVQRGFNQASVYSVLNGNLKTYRGYAWRASTLLDRAIEARCPTTGAVLLRFRAVKEIQAKGYDLYCIRQAIKHDRTYRHLRWAYVDTANETGIEHVASCSL